MAGVGRYVTGCRVLVKSVFVFDFRCFGTPRIQQGEMIYSHPVFIALGGQPELFFLIFLSEIVPDSSK